jgi:hypothetical protein
MFLLALIIWQVSGLPEVEDPIPDRIGLGHLFALAGAGGVLGGIWQFRAPPAERERAVGWGTLAGFCVGAFAYCVLLLLQIISSI